MKKFLSLAAALLLVFALLLAGCGNRESADSSEEETKSVVSEQKDGEDEEDEEDEDAADSLSAGDSAGSETDSDAGTADYSEYCDLSYIDSDNNIVIPLSEISEEAIYAGYVSDDGTVMEVIVVAGSDGEIYYAANTCQVCSGSPYAYYVQDSDRFVCQNCGNSFSAARLGSASGGCNPVALEGVKITDDSVVISGEALEEYESYFKNWKGINV